MSNRNRMPGLRLKGGVWQIEKRCKECAGGWLRESTGCAGRVEAESYLIRRLAELKEQAQRKTEGVFTFEQAGIRSLNEGDRVSFVLEEDRRGRGKQAGQLQKA